MCCSSLCIRVSDRGKTSKPEHFLLLMVRIRQSCSAEDHDQEEGLISAKFYELLNMDDSVITVPFVNKVSSLRGAE